MLTAEPTYDPFVMAELDPDDCWEVVQNRDERYDGAFVTAVRTTKIYCRPSCPARHPKRENVEFFRDGSAARAAGYRACHRCRPDDVDAHSELVREVCAYLDAHLDTTITLADLSKRFHISPFHLQRVFKRVVGVSPRQYADAQRVAQFKSRLKDGSTVTTALYDAGYSSSSQLYPGQLGMKPTDYQRGGEGLAIDYVTAPCQLGYVLVAATERGVCAIELGDSPETLVASLQREFPAAEINCADSREDMVEWLHKVLEHIAGDQPRLDLPLDVRATAFQRRVWEALRAIPYGSTRSYSEIAQVIGQPTAARAVARACATNPTALVVPCHRVVRENGDLGGYKWGIERKQRILDTEAAKA